MKYSLFVYILYFCVFISFIASKKPHSKPKRLYSIDSILYNKQHKKATSPNKFSFLTIRRKHRLPSFFQMFRMRQLDPFRFKETAPGAVPSGDVKSKEEMDSDVGPIVKKGWLRFLRMPLPRTRKDGVKTFFINDVYYSQFGLNCSKKESDEWGPVKIPNQFSFFFILTRDSIYIVSARLNTLAKTVYVIPLSSLVKQEEGIYAGGVEDQGNYREGFCFKLNQMTTNGNTVFVVCAESMESKDDWMMMITKMKMKTQYVLGGAELEGEALLGGKAYKKDAEPGCDEYGNGKGKRDGKWVVLQSWSTCTVACGGGTQTLQRMCVPPMNGGKDCLGDKIITRPCNTNPCRDVINVDAKEETANAKVRVMRVSDRPWIYERCVIKETDVDVVREDMIQFQVKPRVPGRAVLNNKTFTVFQTTNYDSVLFSAPLAAVSVFDFKEDPEYCFTVMDASNPTGDRKVSMCGLKSSKQDLKQLKDKWVEDIEFFKSNCFKPMRRKTEDPVHRLRKQEIEVEELENNADMNTQESFSSQANNQAQGMDGVTQLALNALAKEMKYERSMEEEELKRERLEDMRLQEHMETMRQKDNCLKRNFKRQALKATGQAEMGEMDKQMKDLKDSIKNIITKNRAEKGKKILFMRRMAERNRKKNMGEMEGLRMKMAADAIKAEKKGNMSLCFDTAIIQKYCNDNFLDDPSLNIDCKDQKNYCYVCCENEYGMIWPSERSKCMNGCDSAGGGNGNGNWVWVPAGNQISGSSGGDSKGGGGKK